MNKKGITLDGLGKYEEAIKCFDKALKIYSDDTVWNNRDKTEHNLSNRDLGLPPVYRRPKPAN